MIEQLHVAIIGRAGFAIVAGVKAGRRKPSTAANRPAHAAPPAFPTWVAVIVIVFAGAIAYANSFGGVFVLDDKNAIALNPCIRTLWPLTVSMNAPRDTTLAGRPVASLSFALTYAAAPADAATCSRPERRGRQPIAFSETSGRITR